MSGGEKQIQTDLSAYDQPRLVVDNEQNNLSVETKNYSIAPFESRHIGRCTQIAYTVTAEVQEKNRLTDTNIFILVKTPLNPFESPSKNGFFFDKHHFNKVERIPLRISSSCLPGSLGDLQCNCFVESIEYMKEIAEEGVGVFVYMPQEALGRGLREKVRDHRLIFGIDDKGKRIPPMSENEALKKLHPEGYEIRSYSILKNVFQEIGLYDLIFENLGENEQKRLEIIDQTGLKIEKKIKKKMLN